MFSASLRHEAALDRLEADKAADKHKKEMDALQAEHTRLRNALAALLFAVEHPGTDTLRRAKQEAEETIYQTRT